MAIDPSGMSHIYNVYCNGNLVFSMELEGPLTQSEIEWVRANNCVSDATVEVNGRSEPINYAQLASWFLPSGGNIGPGGGGGGGGGGASGSGQKAANNEQKTDCEKYVDALVGHASGYKSNYTFTGSIRFGIDLYKRAKNGIQFSSFGLAPNWSGFKVDLVSGGQKSGVYRHVSASIGSVMMAGGGIIGMLLPAIQTLWYDVPAQINGNTEALAQMHGNATGILLAPAFNSFFDGHGQTELLKNSLMGVLCEK
jgi:hypothetical protein